MFISAYWHGIAPGYFMGFMCVPFLTQTEDLITKAFKYDYLTVYKVLNYVLKHVSFSFTGMAFLLLDYNSVVNCWRAAGWAILWVNLACVAVSLVKIAVMPAKKPVQKSD